MPFKSDKQRAYLFSEKPEVAKKFAEDTKRKDGKSDMRRVKPAANRLFGKGNKVWP